MLLFSFIQNRIKLVSIFVTNTIMYVVQIHFHRVKRRLSDGSRFWLSSHFSVCVSFGCKCLFEATRLYKRRLNDKHNQIQTHGEKGWCSRNKRVFNGLLKVPSIRITRTSRRHYFWEVLEDIWDLNKYFLLCIFFCVGNIWLTLLSIDIHEVK